MSARPTRFLRYWLPPILWVVVILVASTDLMSAQHTSRFIGPFLRWLVPDIGPEAVLQVQLVVRKTAHVLEYALLAMLLLRAFRAGQGSVRWSHIGRAVAVAALCAATDEFHQSFVASRTGSPADVLIDISGAIAGVAVFTLLVRRKAARGAHQSSES